MSHPVWVRGLKPVESHEVQILQVSHPVWVRGLKHSAYKRLPEWLRKSHPVWVRGLKQEF